MTAVFHTIGNHNIKLSNIKDFGMAGDHGVERIEVKIKVLEIHREHLNIAPPSEGFLEAIGSAASRFAESVGVDFKIKSLQEKLKTQQDKGLESRYLFITIYQNDNYKFFRVKDNLDPEK